MIERIRQLRNEDGFTLVELLLVIIIISVLVAIVIFGIASFRQQAQTACTEANNRTLATARQAYMVNFPGASPTNQQLLSAGYISELPTC